MQNVLKQLTEGYIFNVKFVPGSSAILSGSISPPSPSETENLRTKEYWLGLCL